MFRSAIVTTALTNDAADSYFGHRIRSESYHGDNSMKATLRALLDRRMPADDFIGTTVYRSGLTDSQLAEDGVLRELLENKMNVYENWITFVSVTGSETHRTTLLERIKGGFVDAADGYCGFKYHELPAVTELFKNSFKVLCYICPEYKSVVVFIDNLTMAKYHYIQCAILGMLPWYHTKETGMTEEELKLIWSFKETTPDKYLAAIEAIAAHFDFETGRIKKLLAGFEISADKRRLESLNRNVANLRSDINSYSESIARAYKSINDNLVSIAGLEAKISGAPVESELMNYFMKNKNVKLRNVDGNIAYFEVYDYLSYFDEDAVKRYLKNGDGFVFRHVTSRNNTGITKEQMIKFINNVFIEQEVKIRFCAAFYMDISSCRVNYDNRGSFTDPRADTCLRNTHIQYFGCLGNNRSAMDKCMGNADYIGVIQQCMAATRNLNWHDSTVMGRFFDDLDSVRSRFCELPDGTLVTFKDAVKWIDEHE